VARIDISLDAVIVAVTNDDPRVLVVDSHGGRGLPAGPLAIPTDLTLELGARRCVLEQTGLDVGYAEQLYTFGDRDRLGSDNDVRPISVAYLALVEETPPLPAARWIGVYDLLPWEDQREGIPAALEEGLRPTLDEWGHAHGAAAAERVQLAFGPPWDGIRVVERYELLYESGLIQEYAADRNEHPAASAGVPLQRDHRRIVAVALSRLRGKLTYRPVVFELLADRFTLLDLQRTVEALAGVRLHKQNFRRLVARSGLVVGTGVRTVAGRGRPAELFRYRPAVLLERTRPGVGQPYR
jgi:hypothetical protein